MLWGSTPPLPQDPFGLPQLWAWTIPAHRRGTAPARWRDRPWSLPGTPEASASHRHSARREVAEEAVCLLGQESEVHPQLVSIESLSLMASSQVRRQHYTDPALLTHLTQPLVPHLGTRERHGDRSGADTIGVNLQTPAALGFHQSKRLHWLKSHSILSFPLILHNKRGSVPQPIISATWEAEAGGSGLQILGYAGSSRPGWGIYRP